MSVGGMWDMSSMCVCVGGGGNSYKDVCVRSILPVPCAFLD